MAPYYLSQEKPALYTVVYGTLQDLSVFPFHEPSTLHFDSFSFCLSCSYRRTLLLVLRHAGSFLPVFLHLQFSQP